ncbi:MAG: MaoC family dehydratase [Alphaproteobacteria bacterium]|jgi:acyl dehydratase|nr:MaoC family dehydratase [Alphaproteobacteria bacterium]
MLFFEDLEVGQVQMLPTVTVDEAAIVDFARRYDPQPMHLDPVAAAESAFGGLVASGWHTCAVSMRMLADWFRQAEFQGMGSPGLESVRWLAPVRPGDVLTGSFEILEKRLSRSKPMGFIKQNLELRNQQGEVVLRSIGFGIVRCRQEARA